MTNERSVPGGSSDRARSVYALHVTDPSSVERNDALLKTLFLNLIGPPDAGVAPKVGVRIIERRTARILYECSEDPDTAQRMASMIAADLDRLDPAEFAREWNLDNSA